jgi:hypothetical protein
MLGIVDRQWTIIAIADSTYHLRKHIEPLDHSICSHNIAYLPTFTPEQHATEVYTELFEAVQKLSKPAKKKLLRKIAKALETLANPQTSEGAPSEGEKNSEGDQRVEYEAPPVTTTNDPTNRRVLMTKPRTHQRVTRNNTPGQLPAIINDENHTALRRRSKRLSNVDDEPIITVDKPSSERLPLHTPNLTAWKCTTKRSTFGIQVHFYHRVRIDNIAIMIVILNTCVRELHIRLQAKPLLNTKSWLQCQSSPKYGKRHLEKSSVIRHKEMQKLEKKELILYLSWIMNRFETFHGIVPSHMGVLS